jgi:hypothetical protein
MMDRSKSLLISPRGVATILAGCVLGIMAVNLIGFYLRFWTQHSGLSTMLIVMFDVNRESSIPTWYSGFQLFAVAAVVALIAHYARVTGQRHVWHWRILAGLFVLMGADEMAKLHEWLGGPSKQMLESMGIEATGFLLWSWIVLGGVIALAVGLAFLPFVLRLPRRTCVLVFVSAAVFLGGALGVEAFSGHLATRFGAGVAKVAAQSVEEFFEMTGIAIFIYAMVDYLARQSATVTLSFTSSDAVPAAVQPPRTPAPSAQRV